MRFATVELTEQRTRIDGVDISHIVTGYQLYVGIHDAPRLHIDTIFSRVYFAGRALVSIDRHLDGIDRLRARLQR